MKKSKSSSGLLAFKWIITGFSLDRVDANCSHPVDDDQPAVDVDLAERLH
jgi:hypothetical protein